MTGRNLYRTRSPDGSAETPRNEGRPCVFVSHKNEDREFSEFIGSFFARQGLDVWLDYDQEQLNALREQGDEQGLAREIEAGIRSSTHVLALVTPIIKDSWWMRFEIDKAVEHGLEWSYLNAKGESHEIGGGVSMAGVVKAPDAFPEGRGITDVSGLNRWLSEVSGDERRASPGDVQSLQHYVWLQYRPYLRVT